MLTVAFSDLYAECRQAKPKCAQFFYAECHQVECCWLSVILLCVVMQTVFILSVIMLNVIVQNIIMLSVLVLNIIMLFECIIMFV